MQTDILQRFLDKGLLDLGEDPVRYASVKSAADDLAKNLLENRRDLIAASSILMGGEISEDEPVIKLCKDAITTHWQTYASRFPAGVLQLFRATLLQAVAQITDQETESSNAGVVYYTAAGLLPHIVIKREDELFRAFLSTLAQKVEDEAGTIWALPTIGDAPQVPYGDTLPAAAVIDPKALKEVLKNAIGPAGGAGANPQWPSSNSPEWLDHYGTGSADAIASVITTVTKDAISKSVAQGRTDALIAVKAMNEKLVNLLADNLRAKILYWKEALFSPAKKMGYRQMSNDGVIYWAAYDLHRSVPSFHPLSVEYFLRETVRSAIGDKETKKKLSLEQFCAGAQADVESTLNSNAEYPKGLRLTPLQAVHAAIGKKLDAHTASMQTAIPSQTTIARDEIAVMLFQAFQATRLAGDE